MRNNRKQCRGRRRHTLRSALSAVGLCGLLLLPAALAATGALPSARPILVIVHRPALLADLVRHPLDDAALGSLLLWVSAAAWAYLVACVALDIVARFRGRVPARMPGGGRMQIVIAAVVGAALALAPSPRATSQLKLVPAASQVLSPNTMDGAPPGWRAAAAPARAPALAHAPAPAVALTSERLQLAVATVSDGGAHAPEPDEPARRATAAQVYIVQPGDTLWAIADRELGSPLRWREIGELNRGVVQPDGERLSDDNWLLPGWRLRLPDVAAAVGVPSPLLAPATADSPAPTTVDSPAPTDAATLSASAPASASASASAPAPAPAGVGDTPSARSASWGTDTSPQAPAHRAESPDSPPLMSLARYADGPAGGGGPSRARTAATEGHEARGRPTGSKGLPVAPLGYGIMASAVVLLLDKLRRAQQRRRPRGRKIVLPDGALAGLERTLRARADHGMTEDLHRAFGLLRGAVVECGSVPPPVVAVRCNSQQFAFLMAEGSPVPRPPAPFASSADRSAWVLRRDPAGMQSSASDAPTGGADLPLPAFVTLGADAEGVLLVDLERMGSLSVSGHDAPMVLQGMVVELCTLGWADGVDVVVVGHSLDLPGMDRLRRAPSIAAVVAELRNRIDTEPISGASAHERRVSDERWSSPDACWDPVVVVCFPDAAEAEEDATSRLVEMAGGGDAGLAVVTGARTSSARWSVAADGGALCLTAHPRGDWPASESPWAEGVAHPHHCFASEHDLRSVQSPPDLLQGVSGLLDSAQSAATEPLAQAGRLLPVSGTTGSEPATAEIEVLVLGPVAVLGAARPFARAWAMELVVYLAMHRDAPVPNDTWATALWPERSPAAATLHSTASAARRALGIDGDGSDHLPRAHGRLSLGAEITSDWDRFETLARSASPADWEGALALVRGRPFEGLRSPDWTVLEGVLATVEARVVDVACRLSEHALSKGEPGLADWSARQGLKVSQYDERLYRVLLRAADAAGNPAGVERTMRELLQLVADDVEPYDAVHPETLDLYRELSRRRRSRPAEESSRARAL